MRETAITCNDFGEYIETSRETVCDYKRYCLDVCFNIVSVTKIGGYGLNVEIDESKFGTTKDFTLKANGYLVLYVVKPGNSLLFLLIKETVQL